MPANGATGNGIGRRRLLKTGAGALGGAAAASLAGSMGVRPARAQATTAKPDGLTMLYATVEADSDAIKSMLDAFRQEFGFPIKLDTMPYNALQQKVFAELASKSAYYDIMIVDTPWMPALTETIQPLTDMILDNRLAAPNLDIADFIPKVFYDTAVYKRDKSYLHWSGGNGPVDPQQIRKAGFEIYGLPVQANVLTLAYRKDLFAAGAPGHAGQAVAAPETWDDFLSTARLYTNPRKRLWGTTMMAGPGDWATDDFKTLLACFGGDGYMINDRFEPVFASSEGVEALTFYGDMISKYRVTPPGTSSASWDTAATEFGTGLTAMSLNYHTLTLSPNVHGSIEYAMVPKKVQYGPHFGTWMLSVNGFSKNKDWAFRAIQWFTAKNTQNRMLAQQLHPTRRSVYDVASKDAALCSKFGNFYEVLGKSLEVGVGRPRLTNYSDIDRTIWIAVNDVARGAAKPEAALKRAADQVKTLLAQAGYKQP